MSAQYLATLAGHGNDIYFGNVVRASIALIAYICCCQNTASFGRLELVYDEIAEVNGVREIPAYLAPIVVLVGSNSQILNYSLSRPNDAAMVDCPIGCLVIINCTDQELAFDPDPAKSRLKKSDVYRVMKPGFAYVFYYDKEKNFWFRSCGLGQELQ